MKRFPYNLVFQASSLEKRLINTNVTVVFKDAIEEIIHKSLIEPNAFLRSINVVVSPIRDEMWKVRNTYGQINVLQKVLYLLYGSWYLMLKYYCYYLFDHRGRPIPNYVRMYWGLLWNIISDLTIVIMQDG